MTPSHWHCNAHFRALKHLIDSGLFGTAVNRSAYVADHSFSSMCSTDVYISSDCLLSMNLKWIKEFSDRFSPTQLNQYFTHGAESTLVVRWVLCIVFCKLYIVHVWLLTKDVSQCDVTYQSPFVSASSSVCQSHTVFISTSTAASATSHLYGKPPPSCRHWPRLTLLGKGIITT